MRHTLLGVLLAILISPIVASAQSVAELQAQIASLIQQIQAMQQGGLPGAPTLPPTAQSVTAPSGGEIQCPHVSRVLRRGMSGTDVSRLQQFLALDPAIFPEAQVTGFYGALTEAAVKRFQCKHKIVCDGNPSKTGYGVVGPRTAAILALQCPDVLGTRTPQIGGFIKVTPISGAAPLNATIEATVNTTKSCTGAMYEIDFGDGGAPVPMPIPQGVCSELRQVFAHTYQYGGTFIVTLRSGIHRTTATIQVSGPGPQPPGPVIPGNDTFEVSATSGTAPVTLTFTGIINAAGQCSAGPYVIEFGDGGTAALPLSGCTPSSYTVTHQYSAGGNFIARLKRGSAEVGARPLVITGGTTSGSYGAYFAVTPAVGDSVDVTAQFEIATPCTGYDLDWGDGSTHELQAHSGSCSGGVTSKQFTHDYPSSGTYTITLRRGSGFAAVDTASITISE
jgi:peptidoglycan hydrolase-like protein with peptidoglycan-binding domain